MTNIAELKIDTGKCTGCGLCVKVCPGSIISIGGADKATHGDITEFGWDGCWKCMHCLAVCPQGAISVLGMAVGFGHPEIRYARGVEKYGRPQVDVRTFL